MVRKVNDRGLPNVAGQLGPATTDKEPHMGIEQDDRDECCQGGTIGNALAAPDGNSQRNRLNKEVMA